jgi:hypothetical protein
VKGIQAGWKVPSDKRIPRDVQWTLYYMERRGEERRGGMYGSKGRK